MAETAETQAPAPPAQRRPVTALLVASTISAIGSMLTIIALPWFVLETTGSAAKTGLTGFFVALPGFVAGIFGGTLVDRFGYKRASVVADLISGLGIMAIPLLYDTIGLAYWQLLAFVFVGALLEIPGLTARRSLLPELATLARLRLEQVNSAFEAIQGIAVLTGPPLAGLLIVWMGARNVLWLDAASFALSAATVWALVPALQPATARAAGVTGHYWEELKAGLRFLYHDRLLFSLAISLGISNFFSGPLVSVVLPVYVDEHFGRATVLGILAAVFGAGSLVGALSFGAFGHRLPRRLIWVVGFSTFAIPIWTMYFTHALPWLIASIVLAGLVDGPLAPLLVTVRHERIPAEMRGRVFATFSAITAAATPLGMVVAGVIIQAVGLQPLLLILAVATMAIGTAMYLIRVFREMDRPVATTG